MKQIFLILTLISISMASHPQNQLSITEQLAHSTVRIEVETKQGIGTGTGFFFNFNTSEGEIPVIITNKHVIEGAINGRFTLTLKNDDNTPNIEKHLTINFDNFENRWIKHPKSDIDLAVMPIAPLINEASKKNTNFFYKSLSEDNLPKEKLLNELTPVEEILMVGYPIGLSDIAHNFPIFRKGVSATNPSINYNNKPEFVIDAACFPGSSGSPVFLYNMGNYTNRTGGTIIGTRFSLLGILYAGPMYNATGEIVVVNIPTKNDSLLNTKIPTNLGYVIKASEILAFKDIFTTMMKNK